MARDDHEQPSAADGGRGWRFYAIAVLVVLALLFVLQNTDETNVNFLFAETRLPLFFALLIAIALGALIGWLTPRVRGGKRRDP